MAYFDHSATTPVHPEVQDLMLEINCQHFGNPSSIHRYGQKARAIIEQARKHPNLHELEGTQGIGFQEHAAYQTAQSSAFASEKLTMDEAYTVYLALGESWNDSNEGWARGTDLATKVTVTRLMGELLGVTA